MSERNGKSYGDSIRSFYGKELSEINRSLLYSLHKRTPLSEPKRDLGLERAMWYDADKKHGDS